MKLYNKIALLLTLILATSTVVAKQKPKFEHKIIAGYNFGGTMPFPLPGEIREINSYWPLFTPQLGYGITYNYDDQWALKASIILENKGMGVTNKVKYMYTDVVMDGSSIKGYFVGRNQTSIKISYLTIPIKLAYSVNDKWQINGGGFFSYRSSSEFSGTVWDGYLRQTDDKNIINSKKIDIEDKWDAQFDFGKEMRDIDLGVVLGAERKLNQRFGLYGEVSYSITPIFPSSFKGLEYKMHNFYVALGITYKL